MRKVIAICFAAALIMQSCSTGKMFSHKRYGHLKWIDHDTKVETKGNGLDPVTNNTAQKTENVTKPGDSKTEIKKTEEIAAVQNTVPASTTIEEEIKMPISQQTPLKNDIVPAQEFVNDAQENNNDQVVSTPKETYTQPASPKLDGDVLLILCIILCFFIPPLAMYLWDKNTDSWFIIDLVLFLCLFLLIFGYYGLIGLLAVIIALLRVLGLL